MHCGISEMLSWKRQCITSDLQRSVEGSIELVVCGHKYIMLNLGRSCEGSNKWKLIMQCRGSEE